MVNVCPCKTVGRGIIYIKERKAGITASFHFTAVFAF